MDELSEEDKLTVARARKIQRFLSQPFFVAEVFTGSPGKLVDLDSTIKGFDAICKGEHDNLPEAAFYMVGTIEEAIEKLKKWQKKRQNNVRKFNLEIISPNEIVLKSEVEEVIIPAFEGQMTILKDHIALITYLRPGYIQVSNSNKKEVFFVEEGTVEFSKNNLLILSSKVVNVKDLTGTIKENIIKDSTAKLSSNKISDKEKYILSYKIESLKEIAQ